MRCVAGGDCSQVPSLKLACQHAAVFTPAAGNGSLLNCVDNIVLCGIVLAPNLHRSVGPEQVLTVVILLLLGAIESS